MYRIVPMLNFTSANATSTAVKKYKVVKDNDVNIYFIGSYSECLKYVQTKSYPWYWYLTRTTP